MIVPTVAFPPLTVLTDQVTFVLLLPVTVAVNCCVCSSLTVAVVGLIVTATVFLPPPPQPVCTAASPAITAINDQPRIMRPPAKFDCSLNIVLLRPVRSPRMSGSP